MERKSIAGLALVIFASCSKGLSPFGNLIIGNISFSSSDRPGAQTPGDRIYVADTSANRSRNQIRRLGVWAPEPSTDDLTVSTLCEIPKGASPLAWVTGDKSPAVAYSFAVFVVFATLLFVDFFVRASRTRSMQS